MRKPRFLTYQQIGEIAQQFLQKYHPSFDIPVPIEAIIEFKLGLNIFPFPNPKGLFRDMQEIPDSAWSYMANEIGRLFEVSPSVISCRINRAGIDRIVDLRDL
jgi:hypothetical protein